MSLNFHFFVLAQGDPGNHVLVCNKAKSKISDFYINVWVYCRNFFRWPILSENSHFLHFRLKFSIFYNLVFKTTSDHAKFWPHWFTISRHNYDQIYNLGHFKIIDMEVFSDCSNLTLMLGYR